MNATIPVFLVIVIGYFLRKKGMVNEEYVDISNKILFHISMPASLFQDISNANINEVLDVKMLAFCMIVSSISFFCIWGGAKLFIKDKEIIGAFVQASFRSSAAIMGISFVKNMYGDLGMTPLMIIGCVPLFNAYSVILLSIEGKGRKGIQFKEILMGIVKNPIIIGILLGLIGSVSGFNKYSPVILNKTIDNIAVLTSPLALLSIGAGFKGKEALAKMKPTVVATFIKLVALPAIFIPIAILLGFRNQDLVALLIMTGAPTTVSCFIMAKSMNNDEILSGSVIVLSTILSSFTITFSIYLLKILGYI
ncbi:AEC family transporter [Anaeromicropila populeti]|nr:AEC family transporter [Anaeromicropila populeti]